DEGEGGADVFDSAFGPAGANRISARTPRKLTGYLPADTWRVYRGAAGDLSADTLVHEQPFYPGGRRSGGYGFHFGYGGFGWDGRDAKGFGHNFGYGEFGFDCEMIEYATEPLAPGVYPWKTTVVDAAGNESTATEGAIALDTYARPASGLTVESYDQGTDALELSWTASEDLS
ncbi:hypothetical protein LCGC14_2863360, partial [marine sediment metagenome]